MPAPVAADAAATTMLTVESVARVSCLSTSDHAEGGQRRCAPQLRSRSDSTETAQIPVTTLAAAATPAPIQSQYSGRSVQVDECVEVSNSTWLSEVFAAPTFRGEPWGGVADDG